jgi:hypothetical protein
MQALEAIKPAELGPLGTCSLGQDGTERLQAPPSPRRRAALSGKCGGIRLPRPQLRTLAISSLTPGPMVELKLTFLM